MTREFSLPEGEPISIRKERDRQSALMQVESRTQQRFAPTRTPPAWMQLPDGWEVIGCWKRTFVVWNWFRPEGFDWEVVDEADAQHIQEILAYEDEPDEPEFTRRELAQMSGQYLTRIMILTGVAAALFGVLRGCSALEEPGSQPLRSRGPSDPSGKPEAKK